MHTYLHATTIKEKRGHEFEWQQGGVYGRVWTEEREGGNDVIITSKNETKTKKK